MTRMKSLAARFYRLKSGHVPTGVYLNRLGHRDDNKGWLCGATVSHRWEHHFRHRSQWKDHQEELWKPVGKAACCTAGRCRNVQISELFSIEECNQAVRVFRATTEVRKFPPNVK
jgi:hypothetical protein